MQMWINMDAAKGCSADLKDPESLLLFPGLQLKILTWPIAQGSGVCLFAAELTRREYSRNIFPKSSSEVCDQDFHSQI